MTIRTPNRRRRARAVVMTLSCCIAPCSLAAFDTDPANDNMAGADTLTTIADQQITHTATLIQAPDRLDVDFFMIDTQAGDTVTIRLSRATEDGVTNSADLNLRLHAYTPGADLISAPGIGTNPTLTFTSSADGVVYLGVGLEGDSNLDGVDDANPGLRGDSIGQVETYSGLYDIQITVNRAAPQPPGFILEDPADCDEEVNADCPPTQTLYPADGTYLIGSLVKRDYPDCQPDTFLVLFDKELNVIASDDNNSSLGNGWASGLLGVNDALGFIDNGNGTRSLRIGVTGRPDGLDGLFNGLFLNAPHHEFGEFTLTVTFVNAGDGPVAEYTYVNRFDTGAEAFYINYDVPPLATFATINIDNTTGAIAALPDQDVYHIEGLIPFCDYFISQVGGLNSECLPTDTVMVWVDKNCGIIWDSNEYNPATGYEELNIIADYLGRANFAIAGEDQRDRLLWTGLDMNAPDALSDRAIEDCILPDPDIDDGCYTLCIRLAPPHPGANGPMQDGDVVGSEGSGGAADNIIEAMSRGDINMDGRTDTADLGVLIANFGWTN